MNEEALSRILHSNTALHHIPCGDCNFDEVIEMNSEDRDELKRLQALLGNYQEQTTQQITTLTTSLSYIKEGIDWQRQFSERMDQRQDTLERKLDQYNNLRERTDALERAESERAVDYVPRREFNGALGSVREFAEGKAKAIEGRVIVVMWAMGITWGALGFLAAHIFGG